MTCLPQTLNCVERTRPTTHDYDACSADLGARCEELWRSRHLLFGRIRGVCCHIYLAVGNMGLEAVKSGWCGSILWVTHKQRDGATRMGRTNVTRAYIEAGCRHNVSIEHVSGCLGIRHIPPCHGLRVRSESEMKHETSDPHQITLPSAVRTPLTSGAP